MQHDAWSTSIARTGSARPLRSVRSSAVGLVLTLLIALGRAGLASRVEAQTTSATSLTLTVIVLDSVLGDPVGGVLVHLRRSPSIAALTNDRGRVVLTDVPVRLDTLVLKRVGYHARELVIDPSTLGETFTVRMARERVSLDSVVVSASLWPQQAEFEKRRRMGVGVFYDRADLDRLHPGSMNELLRTSRGFRQEHGSSGSRVRSARSLGGMDCSLLLFINGAPVSNEIPRRSFSPGVGSLPVAVLDGVPVEMVQAVELYNAGEVPAEYNRAGAACGVVVLWMRSSQ